MKKKLAKITISVFAAAVSIAAVLAFAAAANAVYYPVKYSEYVKTYSEKYALPESLVYAVIHTESRFKPDSVSPRGACGLMQLSPATAAWIAEKRGIPYDETALLSPEINIELGCAYLSYLTQRFGGESEALAAYNAGPSNLEKWLAADGDAPDWQENIPFKETRDYLKKVSKARDVYRSYAKRGFYL